jgi:hypothetical protein
MRRWRQRVGIPKRAFPLVRGARLGSATEGAAAAVGPLREIPAELPTEEGARLPASPSASDDAAAANHAATCARDCG